MEDRAREKDEHVWLRDHPEHNVRIPLSVAAIEAGPRRKL